jgi:nicotinate-nucleotide adenylyltransferase
LFAPAYDPPHKPNQKQASFADRLSMVKLLIKGHPGLEACDIESRLARCPSYTYDVLSELEKERPDERLQLLIGSDSLRQLHTWGHAQELAEHYEILTWPRPDEQVNAAELSKFWTARQIEKLLNGVLFGNFFEISSTKIRNNVAKWRKTGHINSGITPRVWEYIREKQLYSYIVEKE